MAKAKLAGGSVSVVIDGKSVSVDLTGVSVDLAGCKLVPGPGEKVALLVSGGGDSNKNGALDFSFVTGVHSPFPIPFLGSDFSTPYETVDVPLDQALAIMDSASNGLAAVPGAGPALVAGSHLSIGILRGLLAHLP